MGIKSTLTIRDVARAAGVSTQTVSRVINNRPDVSSLTRAHVKKVIKDLGYSPNIIARSLSRGRTNTLGVVGFGLEYFGSSSMLTGIERQANDLGYSISLSLLDRVDAESVEDVLLRLNAQQVAGIIWAVPGFTDSTDVIKVVNKKISVPVVFLNQSTYVSKNQVLIDNRLGGRLAVEHLFEQGYRKIGLISGPGNWWESNQRLLGWRDVVTEKELPADKTLLYEGNWEAESGALGFKHLLAVNPDMDAVFVSNDQMALGVIQAAHHMNVRIPADLGVVGFDDIPESGYFIPPLTTVKQDARLLGAEALLRLHENLEAEKSGETFESTEMVLKPELIIRQSSLRTM
jgi:DNA-binding LacI/PurR family transcriptional regulator